jgi:hypothetical protein
MAVATARGQEPREKEAFLEELRLYRVKDDCKTAPKSLINEIRFFDPSQADSEVDTWVEFKMFPPEGWEAPTIWTPGGDWKFTNQGAKDWFWQSVFIDWLHDPKLKKYLVLKARQLGITLLACAYALWLMLFRPGSVCVAYSFTEDEAKKLVVAQWAMFNALPAILKSHVEVLTPRRSEEPAEWIKLRHEDGRVSSFQALPATKKHGHGARVTFAIMDEVAYMDHARRIYTAINPATTRGRAKLLMISTAFGVSNAETGEGNYFHNLYATKKQKKLAFRFLPWNLEPTRDASWYDEEAMKLDEVERNQQYPLNENDAFMLSGALFFPREALDFYRGEIADPVMTGQFFVSGRRRALFRSLRDGVIDIYEKPKQDGKYAIGVDTATGRGSDYTVAHVIDLSSGAIVATMRAKIEAPRAAIQLHYLGKWYHNAMIAVERQGGYGEALIIALRDGNQNLPPYVKLYRHTKFTSGRRPKSEDYGHPMGPNARGQILDGLKSSIRDRLFPWMPATTQDELQTFVYKDTIPSPRAQDGCNDDCVMSLGLANEMWRQYGEKPAKKRRARKAKYRPPPTRSGVNNG